MPVNNGRFINPADVLVQLTDVSHLHLRLRIFEKDIPHIRVGQSVRFAVGADTTQTANTLPHRATIFLIGKAIAPDRTIEVLAHPDGRASDLIPGSYLSAQIVTTTESLTTLPETAIVQYGGHAYVYQLEQGPATKSGEGAAYRFQQIEVKTGVRQAGYVAVQWPGNGSERGGSLVVKGAYNLLAKLNNSEEE